MYMNRAYSVYDIDQSSSTGTKVLQAVINALVIVAVVAVMTFFIVLLYYYNCMKVLFGILIVATFTALSFSSGAVFEIFCESRHLPWDYISYFIIFYNLGVGGCIAIWYQKGIPSIIVHAYLVWISVVVAYMLSFIGEWTVWALLSVLAIWDLIAVLSPCGPLKWMIKLSQNRRGPLPGLIYSVGNTDRSDLPVSRETREQEELERARQLAAEDNLALQETVALLPQEDPMEYSRSNVVKEDAGHGDANEPQTLAEQAATGVGGDFVYDDEEDVEEPMTIREMIEDAKQNPAGAQLGLGDFIFYSVLIAKASTVGAIPMIMCTVCVLSGLVMTLSILLYTHKPLPALPFSMLFGVVGYLYSRYCMNDSLLNWSLKGYFI